MRPYLWDTWERSHSSFSDQYFEVYLPPQESTLPYNWTCTEILPPTHSHQQIHLVWMMENEDILKKEKIMWKVIPSKELVRPWWSKFLKLIFAVRSILAPSWFVIEMFVFILSYETWFEIILIAEGLVLYVKDDSM